MSQKEKETAQSSRTEYTDRATAAAHETVDRVGERAARAEERLRDAADDVGRRSEDARNRARDMREDAVAGASTYVREHPVTSLAIAFGVGVVASLLMRR